MARCVVRWVGVAAVLAALIGAWPGLAAELSATTQVADAKAYYGQVVTPEGKAVAGARVFLVEHGSWDTLGRTVAVERSDAQGRFRLTAAEYPRGVLVQAEGYGLGLGKLEPGATEEGPSEIQISSPSEVCLRFVDDKGSPVAGVQVMPRWLFDERGMALADLPGELQDALAQTTDANGECAFGGMPAGAMLRVDVRDERYAQGYASMNASVGGTKPVVMKLHQAGAISGRVVVGKDSTPVAGVRIGVQPTNDNREGGGGSAVTDARGDYRVKKLPPGQYNVALDLKGKLDGQYTAVAHERLTVEGGQDVAGTDFKLIPGGIIAGRAFVEDTGKPLPGIHIGVYGPAHPQSSAWVQGTETGADGKFTLRVPPGEQYVYRVSSSLPVGLVPKDGNNARDVRNVKVQEGQTATVEFAFRRNLAPGVRGRVVDAEGKPVAQAKVIVETLLTDGGGVVETDADGRFDIPGTPNGAHVSAAKGRAMTEKAVTIDARNRDLTLVIRPSKPASARVVVTADGEPAAGVKLTLWVRSGNIASEVQEQTAGADGTAVFRKLTSTMQYEVHSQGGGYGVGNMKVEVKAGGEVEVRMTVPKAQSFVAGQVLDSEGRPVADYQVEFGSDKSGQRMINTDADGRFRFDDVVAGDRVFVFARKGEKSIRAEDAKAGKDDVVIIVPADKKK